MGFSEEWVFLKQCAAVFQKSFFSPLPAGSRRFFSWYPLWAPGGKSHSISGVSLWWDSPGGFLTLRIVHTGSPAICQLQFRCSYPGTGSYPGGFWSWFCSCKPWHPVLTCHYLGGSGLFLILPPLFDPRSVIDFSICSTCTCF